MASGNATCAASAGVDTFAAQEEEEEEQQQQGSVQEMLSQMLQPTPANAPLLVCALVVFVCCYYYFFMRDRASTSAAACAVKEERLRQLCAAMGTAVAWEEEARRVERRKKEEEREAKEEEAEKKNKNNNNNKEQEEKQQEQKIEKRKEADGESSAEEQDAEEQKKEAEENEEDAEEEKTEEQLQEELRAKMPAARTVFHLLFDRDEHVNTAVYGTRSTKAGCTRVDAVRALLTEALERELLEAMERTLQAREPHLHPLKPWQSRKLVEPYMDGSHLHDIVRLARDVRRRLDASLVPQKVEKRAKDLLRRVNRQRSAGFTRVLRLALPVAPLFIMSAILTLVGGLLTPYTAAVKAKALDRVASGSLMRDGESFLASEYGLCLCTSLLGMVLSMTARSLKNRANNGFLAPLRTTITQALLRQDMEYFDYHNNSDLIDCLESANELCWVCFSLPLDLLMTVMRLVTVSYFVYTAQPALLVPAALPAACMGVVHYFVCKAMQPRWRRQGGLRRLANRSATEMVQKLKLIREFAQEGHEAEKLDHRNIYSAQVQEQTQALSMAVWNGMGFLSEVQDTLVLALGSSMIGTHGLPIGSFMVIREQLQSVWWNLRMLMDRVPELGRALEPASKILDLLGKQSHIEGDQFAESVLSASPSAPTSPASAAALAAASATASASANEDGSPATPVPAMPPLSLSNLKAHDDGQPQKQNGQEETEADAAWSRFNRDRAPSADTNVSTVRAESVFSSAGESTATTATDVGDKLLCPTQLRGKIEFIDVEFAYPSEPRKKVLKKFSFATDPDGEDTVDGRRIRSVAFVGETGCGKSTAVNLLKRFYAQSSGSILIDGIDIGRYDPRFLRRNMAIVAQQTELLNLSLRENIAYGLRPMPSDERIIEVCKMASIWDDVEEMPDRLDTIVNDNLSGGQRQRISVARALIRSPTILLLDEATSALDAVNERVVQRAIDAMLDARGAGCSITIAHRLTTIRNADLIVVMDKGACVEQGTHDELMALEVEKSAKTGKVVRGFYRNLWQVQQGDA